MKNQLLVSEIFGPTIQGEGRNAGNLCFFLRLASCNLHCSFCFGIKPGRRVPMITYSCNQNRKITKVEIGDKLLTFNDKRELVETEVTNILTREVTEWYELKIDNVLYFVTPEHPFFTTRGLVETRNLIVGDMIYHSAFQDKLSFRMIVNNPMKDPETVKKVVANTDYKEQGKRVSRTIAEKKKLGIYQKTWDLMSEEQKEDIRRFHSRKMKGENNPNWAGGPKYPIWEQVKEEVKQGFISECERCGSDKRLQVHHIDQDYENDNRSNFKILCHKCHSIEHQRGYNFWSGPRKDGKVLPDGYAQNGKEVQSIKYVDISKHEHYGRSYGPKKLKVINLSCSPYNSYLVDNMWVHNCDSAFTWRFSDAHLHDFAPVYKKEDEVHKMTVNEVVNKIIDMYYASNLDYLHLVVSGGEPMLQSGLLYEVLLELNERIMDWFVEIETAGTIFDQDLLEFDNLYFNVSPKLENSNNPKELRYKPDVLTAFRGLADDGIAVFKFVVSKVEDFDEIEEIINDIGISRHSVYIMLEGETHKKQQEKFYLVNEIIKRGYNFSARLHTMVWGNKRGV